MLSITSDTEAFPLPVIGDGEVVRAVIPGQRVSPEVSRIAGTAALILDGADLQNRPGRAGGTGEGAAGAGSGSSGTGRVDGEVPPPGSGDTPETGESRRRIIARCNFYDYYLARHGDHSVERIALTDGIMRQIEDALGPDGVTIRLIVSEMRSNYYEHCVDDIDDYYRGMALDPEGDTGHRNLEVSQDLDTGAIYIDYEDLCPVTSTTYNVYAEPFRQEIERVTKKEKAMLAKKRRQREERNRTLTAAIPDEENWEAGGVESLLEIIAENEEEARQKAAKSGEAAPEKSDADLEREDAEAAALASGVLLGSAKKGGTGGRGINMIMQYGRLDESGRVAHSIERFGPLRPGRPRGRGTRLRLVFPPSHPLQPAENDSAVDPGH